MKKSSVGYLFFLFVCSWPVYPLLAQVNSLGIQAYSEFKRELDNFNTSYRSDWNYNWNKSLFGYTANMNNRLFLFNGTPQNAQDEIVVKTWYGYQLSPTFSLKSQSNYYSFTNTQITTFDISSGFVWQKKGYSISPSLGWSSDTRSKRTDSGIMSGLSASLTSIDLSHDFTADMQAGYHYTDLSPRTFKHHFIRANTVYQVPKFLLQFQGGYSFNQRDSYQPNSFFNRDVTNIIEKVLSDSTSFSVRMESELSKYVSLQLYANSLLNVRNFRNQNLDETTENTLIDTEYARQEVQSVAILTYSTEEFNGESGLRFAISGLDAAITQTINISDEILARRNEQLRNTFFDQSNLEVFLKHNQELTENQTLGLNTSASILRFDTPETNFDDRDELFLASDIQYTYQKKDAFKAGMLISAEAYHRVFLFSQRSIENNWRRSLRLQPNLTWLPTPTLRLTNHFLVRANYTVFDFQDLEGTIRDQSSREWGLSHELRYEFHKNWFSTWLFSRNQLIIGQLFWNDFAETPVDTLTTTRLETSIEHISKTASVKLGLRFFLKDDYIPASVLRLNSESEELDFSRLTTGTQQTLQWGPTVSIRWQSSRYGEITLDGWLQMQFLRDRWYLEVPESYQQSLQNLTQFRRTRIFPNLHLRTKLYL